MKSTLTLLAATTAVGALVAIAAFGAIRTSGADDPRLVPLPGAESNAHVTQQEPLLLASGDDDDDSAAQEGGDDDDWGIVDCEEGEDDDDAGDCPAGLNPAPAGTVAPPANGLFGTGAPPQVQVN